MPLATPSFVTPRKHATYRLLGLEGFPLSSTAAQLFGCQCHRLSLSVQAREMLVKAKERLKDRPNERRRSRHRNPPLGPKSEHRR